mmetsp:Transcript_3730/g.13084  ORF Transcript_3730/g.13084 Transcript_3730/m.13084 type:complete len:217 (+) Transcript_3730:4680-5330(+)
MFHRVRIFRVDLGQLAHIGRRPGEERRCIILHQGWRRRQRGCGGDAGNGPQVLVREPRLDVRQRQLHRRVDRKPRRVQHAFHVARGRHGLEEHGEALLVDALDAVQIQTQVRELGVQARGSVLAPRLGGLIAHDAAAPYGERVLLRIHGRVRVAHHAQLRRAEAQLHVQRLDGEPHGRDHSAARDRGARGRRVFDKEEVGERGGDAVGGCKGLYDS